MDNAKIFDQVKKRQQLIDDAKPVMLERSKTGESDVAVINKVDAIMRSNKPLTQKTRELELLLKQVHS